MPRRESWSEQLSRRPTSYVAASSWACSARFRSSTRKRFVIVIVFEEAPHRRPRRLGRRVCPPLVRKSFRSSPS
jgi:hypothetical protein